jgi:hypothetical protein
LLVSPNHDVREQSAWCLGNVAGDGPELRDFALQCNALGPLIANVSQPSNISLLRNCTWSLSNFCRGKPQPKIEIIKQAMPILGAIVNTCNDQDTVIDAAWALSYISDGDNGRIQEVVNLGVIPSLVKVINHILFIYYHRIPQYKRILTSSFFDKKMLNSGVTQIIVPSLRCLGNIVSGNEQQTQAVIDANVLTNLVTLLSHSKKNIRKEACWMLSNIAAGRSLNIIAYCFFLSIIFN